MKLEVFRQERDSLTLVGHLSTESKLYGLHESQHYLIRCPNRLARLFVDDMPVELDSRYEYWRWSPGYYAGEVGLELELPTTQIPLLFVADIGPSPYKTGREQYAEYLADIADYAPELLLGNEPSQHGLGGRSENELNLWIRYARLRQFIDRYISGLGYIIERPIIRTRGRREQVAFPSVKRVDGATLRQLSCNPHVMLALSGTDGLKVDVRDKRIDVPFHEPTYDNPANRLITRQLHAVQRLVRGLIKLFSDYSGQASDTETDIAPRLPRRIAYLENIDRKLARLARSEPFHAADVANCSAAELNAVSGNPHYSMTHHTGVRLLRLGISELAEDEQHYLAPTWEIYEAWCFVAIDQQLQAFFPDYHWRLRAKKPACFLLEGQSPERTLRLYSQMTCRSLESVNQYGYCSISRERRPDLVLEVDEDGSKRFICLDSKYSSSKTRILDSMASAHIYRDSLRLCGRRPELSLILVPANPDVGRLADQEYQERHGVGCVTLSNQNDARSVVRKLLDELAI
ncbi:DUF2357 domain-containing protein [Marinimicrobium sp. ABcell2]|uniref:DUF2357 domain-containing protein n=1 Tax=Marinimicrobium sp. ABcell2 TaxID=3069751 RepID=UPI0027B25FC0|nr:DUF2357 domain-containing protein [Marinimicrobium sp. ABcell2]MDQ2076876.1 DUF2357 domain-containing protein [Marinimicrobium sp. ABcell2]